MSATHLPPGRVASESRNSRADSGRSRSAIIGYGNSGGRATVGDRERLAAEKLARGDLTLEPIHRGDGLRATLLGGLGVDLECPSHADTKHWESGSQQNPRRERLTVGKQWHHEPRVGKQRLVGHEADVRSQLLVEELLERERTLPLRRIVRIERSLRPALLDRGDDSRRIADRPPVEGEHGRRRRIAGQTLGLQDVEPRKQRAADVGDPLVVQRPAHLLVVMREFELPQHAAR